MLPHSGALYVSNENNAIWMAERYREEKRNASSEKCNDNFTWPIPSQIVAKLSRMKLENMLSSTPLSVNGWNPLDSGMDTFFTMMDIVTSGVK